MPRGIYKRTPQMKTGKHMLGRHKYPRQVRNSTEYDGKDDEEKKRLYQTELRKVKKNLVLEHYGRECACCGEDEVKFLCIDHKNNDGREHRKTLKGTGGGSIIIAWIIKNGFPDMFQMLCHNCNMAKGIYGECPHKKNETRTKNKGN